jgi:diaminohydroxyphosphoribosylaminopyrimidine deaminase / 5-amino-6-(5-phosphoribosylamino)uracil reductase
MLGNLCNNKGMKDQDHQQDDFFMRRAIELATLGRGNISPNPLVGSVIVHNNKIIGEGWHQKYGEAHAEVNAIRSVADKSFLPESTLYVNLEPCSHFGKTPPCADLLIHEKVKRVVVSNLDSNPLVAGNGIKKLRAAGVEVVTDVLKDEGRELNKRFFTFIEKKRPYVILKWAQTADGFIARENFDSKWISSDVSRKLVHRWRSEEDAILVGSGTALHDNPRLNVRDWTGRDPVRIVIDRHLKLPPDLNVFDGSQGTICFNLKKSGVEAKVEFVRLSEEGFLLKLLNHLFEMKIQSVIVEGGAETLQAFISEDVWDEARIFTSQSTFEKGIRAPALSGNQVSNRRITTDQLKIVRREKKLSVYL